MPRRSLSWRLAAPQGLRQIAGMFRDYVTPVRVKAGDGDRLVHVLQGVKLYREVRASGRRFIGSGDAEARPVDYVLDALPPGALAGRTVLDLGTAGGAVCFAAAERGCRDATGIEIADWRIRGARAIQQLTGTANVRFVHGNFYDFLHRRRREFDVVFALNVLHHVEHPLPLVRRICRASRELVVFEMPERIDASTYGAYRVSPEDVESVSSGITAEGLAMVMAVHGFSQVDVRPSSDAAAFYHGAEAARSVRVFRRADGVTDARRRRDELAIYRDSRTWSVAAARADGGNIDLRAGDRLAAQLAREYPAEWSDRSVNFILAGPRASGKSHHFDQAGPEHHPPYSSKIFKFPDAAGRRGLRRHLNPPRGSGGMFAQVLLSTLDDEDAHCTREAFVAAVRGRDVVCLLLNVDFDMHVDRLYQREVARLGAFDVDFDVSLRFDCARLAAELKAAGVRYRVVTVLD